MQHFFVGVAKLNTHMITWIDLPTTGLHLGRQNINRLFAGADRPTKDGEHVRCCQHGPRSTVLGRPVRVRGPVPDLSFCPWSMVLGPWTTVHGPWSMVHGPWSRFIILWALVLGIMVCVLGIMVRGPCYTFKVWMPFRRYHIIRHKVRRIMPQMIIYGRWATGCRARPG